MEFSPSIMMIGGARSRNTQAPLRGGDHVDLSAASKTLDPKFRIKKGAEIMVRKTDAPLGCRNQALEAGWVG